ncbi:MAG TPA: glutamate 5-kinase [Phycisphaerae bacterium]|nr:glutamate 5-kinase [Phycisphaerae bacterium]
MSENTSVNLQRPLAGVRRVVVKVGSAVIAAGGHLQPERLAALAQDVHALRAAGYEVVMVVSGAVAAGYRALGCAKPPAEVVERQAAASIGQHRLMAMLDDAFSVHGIAVAQLLMSADDFENRRRFLSAKHTFHMLLGRGAVPVVNENDALSDDEIKVGDNDHLAALVTSVVSADLLIILSRVAGLYANGNGQVISDVHFGADLAEHIQSTLTESGVGGMTAKVSAARLASRWNTPTIIADGTVPGMLPRVVAGEPVGTLFHPHGNPLNARKRWIAVRSRSRGAIRVDAGAQAAILEREASLLPSGVRAVDGDFAIGSRVEIQTEHGETFAVGLVSYPSADIRRIAGRRAADIAAALGYVYTDEIIHRDDLVVLSGARKASA